MPFLRAGLGGGLVGSYIGSTRAVTGRQVKRREEEAGIKVVNKLSFMLAKCLWIDQIPLRSIRNLLPLINMADKKASKIAERSPEADRKNLDLAISGINKQFGPGALMRLGEASKMNIDTISTGSISIDIALGTGGLPRGRIC